MIKIQFLDIWHIMWIMIYIVSTVLLCIWLKQKSVAFQKKVVYSIIIVNFILHFLAPWFIQETTQAFIIRVTMVNVCAVLIFLSPFLYWQKDKFLKPGWLYMCIIGSLGLLIFPEYAIGHDPFSLNILRLFIQHLLLLYVPIIMIVLGHENIRYRDTWTSCVLYIIILIIVIANDAILQVLGVVHDMRWLNGAFQWHPGSLYFIANALAPNVFLTIPIGPNAGEFMHWPIFYMMPIIILFIFPLSIIITGGLLLAKKYLDKGTIPPSL